MEQKLTCLIQFLSFFAFLDLPNDRFQSKTEKQR
jgi:hypothetical protein